jgi:hypothetical protein
MPRQPLLYIRADAEFRIPANALLERPELAALIGQCIAFWSQVEAQLAVMLSAIMKANTEPAAAVFLSIRNSRALRNPTEGGHGFRRKADSNPIIADSG